MSTNLSLLYHLIFSAKHREPWLSPSLRIAVHEYLVGIVKGQSAETRASCCDPVGIECVVKPDSGGAGTPGCDAEDASGIASKMSKLQIMSKAWPGTGGNGA